METTKHKSLIHVSRLVAAMLLAMLVTLGSACNRTAAADNTSVDNGRYRSLVNNTLEKRARQYNASTRYMIVVDYSIPSNQDRFFVWDTRADGIVYSTWCAHGLGGNSTDDRADFSNRVGSNCSSLGLYIVDRSTGKSPRYGYTYHAMDGLNASNSNARVRQILIHYWHSVTSDWENKISSPMNCDYRSAGCFTLPEPGFWKVDEYIKGERKRILLVAIDGVK